MREDRLIARVWRGRTKLEDFEAYSAYLHEAGVKKIAEIAGNLGVRMLRRIVDDHAEFMVISHWPSYAAIEAFAGKDIALTRHLEKDPEFLLELSKTVEHYEIY